MKKVLIGVVVVLVLIAGGVYWLATNADSVVKAAIEEYGSKATKTDVTLDTVELSLTEGKGRLAGLTMGNPEGFKSESAMTLGEISVAIDTASLLGGDTIVIKEIVVGAPNVTYEIGSGGSNFDAIRKNVDAFAGSSGGSGGGGSAEGEKKLIIENLYVRDGKVNVSAAALAGKSVGAPLPTIHLKDIGKDSGGATPAEVAEKVINAISSGATKAVGTLDLDKLMGGASGAAKDAMDKGKEGVGGTLNKLLGK